MCLTIYILRVKCLCTGCLLKKCNRCLLSQNAFQRLIVQGLFSVTFKNCDWLWKKYHISLFWVSDRGATDPLFRLFFATSFGARRLIRKRVWTRVREVPFWHELSFLYWFIWNKDFQMFHQVKFRNVNNSTLFTHRKTDRLPFSLMTLRGHSFFFMNKKKKIFKVSI